MNKYPQIIWSKEILLFLKKSSDYYKERIVDAPCGNGIIGYVVHKGLPKSNLILLDNDPNLYNSIYAIKGENVEIRVEDIFNLNLNSEHNTWLLINSLYCLPDSNKLISENRKYFEYVVAIFPRIQSRNFKHFSKKNPNFPNPSVKSIQKTIDLFHENSYQILYKKNITRIPFHIWNDFFDRYKLTFFLKNYVYNMLDKILFFLPGHYTIIAFKRSE